MNKNESLLISDDSLLSNTFQNLNVFRKLGELCDIIIKTDDGVTIKAHRVVLSASSPYFRAMFTLNFKESMSPIIDLKSINGKALQDLIDYFYTGKICVHYLNVIGIIELCHALQVDKLIEKCEVFLRRNLSTRNSLGLQAFARHYSLSDLKEHARRYSCWNFSDITNEEEFFVLPYSDLKQLISCDTLKAPSEEYVLESIVSWLLYDLPNRQGKFEELLSHIRFPLMSKDFLQDSKVITYVQENFAGANIIINDAIVYHSEEQKGQNVLNLESFTPRAASKDIFVIGGWSNGQKLSTVQCFNVDTLQWTALSNMNVAHVAKQHYFHVIVCNDELFTICFDKVMKYDPIDSAWHKFGPGPEIQCKWAGVCAYNNSFFVIGGNSLKLSKKFNIDIRKWEELPPINAVRYYPGLAVLNDKLYVIGGLDHRWRPIKGCERYDAKRGVWEEVATMGSPRWNLGVAVLNGKLYALGGNHNVEHFANTVEVYDPKLNTWDCSIASMNCGRRCLGVAVVNGFIYVVGGRIANSIEYYNHKTNDWKIVGSVNAYCSFGCVALRLI